MIIESVLEKKVKRIESKPDFKEHIMENEVRQIITQLKNNKISLYEIPEEYEDNFDIIKAERTLGLREISKRGYDILSDNFFVEESLGQFYKDIKTVVFDNFTSYYNYLEGDVYENAVYYQLEAKNCLKI